MLIRGLRHGGFCVMYHDRDLAVRLVENRFDSWPETATILALGDSAIFTADTAARVIAAKRRVLETGAPERVEAHLTRGDIDCWYEINIDPDTDSQGRVRGLFVTASDITELKHREETLRGLLADVSHRSRNLLAIIQSILGQTVRLESDPGEFGHKLRGRIRSLAITQDLVTQANWQGARLRHLAAAQLDPFTEHAPLGLALEGEDAHLGPNMALHIGLALHELAANSAAHGVLREKRGHILISAATRNGRLRLTWSETHATPAATPGASRFGSAVLTKVLPIASTGRASLKVTPSEVHYTLEIPASAVGN